MKWRLIEQQGYNAAMNMAVEHAIYESVANGRESPTIRFYKWLNSSISIGAYQNPKDVNIDACKNHNIGIVRRMTGGRAVFHDKIDLTYSVIAPIRVFNYSIKNAYLQICSCIINALKGLGINATLENKNDIFVDGKKISGNAAKLMDKGIYLQHGTLIYDIDFEIMPLTLNISKDTVKEKVTSILQHKIISQEEVYETLKNNFISSYRSKASGELKNQEFLSNKEFKIEELSKFELMRAEDLARTKYNTIMTPAGTLLKNKGACYVERGS